MNYLFFDIECANCYNGKGKIYSFGYLICDHNFKIKTPPCDILINPDCKFDPYVKKNILAYPKELVKASPKFNEVYEQIKQLMTAKNTVCFGYGIDNDLHFLADDCKRYSLEKIQARVYDVQKLIAIALAPYDCYRYEHLQVYAQNLPLSTLLLVPSFSTVVHTMLY